MVTVPAPSRRLGCCQTGAMSSDPQPQPPGAHAPTPIASPLAGGVAPCGDMLQRILRARVYDVAIESPLDPAPNLSRRLDNRVLLKREDLQPVFSFKLRGAYNKMAGLSAGELARGVIAASAGNHAQGVALAAQRLGCKAVIVMPVTTPDMKVRAVASRGAEVLLHGDTYDAAYGEARRLEQERGLSFIHPFDDPDVIAGQGTIGLELAERGVPFDDVVIPIGGGGLFAGIAVALQEAMPAARLTGVEAAHYPSMLAALENRAAPAPAPALAEGIAVKAPGKLTLPIIRDRADRIVLVDEAHLEIAVETLAEIEKTVAEGAGAAALAAVMAEPERFTGRRVCLILSGGNIDSFILAQALLRGLARERRIVRLRVEAPDQPGSLALTTRIIAEQGGNVLEVRHERLSFDVPIKATQIDFVLETEGREHLDRIVAALRASHIEAEPMSPLAHAAG